MRMVNVNVQGDAIEFGVYLTHTNAPTPFGFAGYQIFLSFNPEIDEYSTGNILLYFFTNRICISDLFKRSYRGS